MGFYYSDDPVADFSRHDAAQNRRLAQRPVCSECEEHIQDEEAYYINGEWICESCMEGYKREVLPE